MMLLALMSHPLAMLRCAIAALDIAIWFGIGWVVVRWLP